MIEQPLGVAHRAVGIDDLTAAQLAERRDQCRIGRHTGQIDFVHEGEEFVRVDPIDRHQPVQGRAVLAGIGTPQVGRRPGRQVEPVADELVHPLLHLVE